MTFTSPVLAFALGCLYLAGFWFFWMVVSYGQDQKKVPEFPWWVTLLLCVFWFIFVFWLWVSLVIDRVREVDAFLGDDLYPDDRGAPRDE
jgi:hypothetical protein